jgi:hypothetical protein
MVLKIKQLKLCSNFLRRRVALVFADCARTASLITAFLLMTTLRASDPVLSTFHLTMTRADKIQLW